MKQINIDIIQTKPTVKVEVMSNKPVIQADILPPAVLKDNDYNTLKNLPSINGETVIGHKSGKDYNLANEDEFQEHVNNKDNPHEVTKEQIGLGQVDNTSDKDKPISNAQAEVNDKLKSEIRGVGTILTNHKNDKDNPHKVTTEQIGAVPKRLTTLTNVIIKRATLSTQFLYVDDNGTDKKVSMQQLKEMNTKVVMTDDIAKVNMDKLIVGDILFEVKK